MTSTANTNEYPYQVGRMVYRTLEQARTKAAYAKIQYPSATIKIVDRRSGETVEEMA